MSSIEVKQWENEILGISVWSIKIRGEYYFFGKEVAEALKYSDPKKTIQNRIDPEEKKSIEELLGKDYKKILEQSLNSTGDKISPVEFFQKLRRNQNLLTEFGLYSFCGESKKEKAKPFQKWVFNTIKTIRKTGFYTLPGGPVENPLDLIAKVSNLEREIQSLKKETKTCDKGTQTRKSVMVVKDSFRELERKIEKSLRKTKLNLEKSLGEISPCSSSSSSFHYSSESE